MEFGQGCIPFWGVGGTSLPPVELSKTLIKDELPLLPPSSKPAFDCRLRFFLRPVFLARKDPCRATKIVEGVLLYPASLVDVRF